MERDGGPQRKKRRVVLSEEMASTLVAEWCGSLRGVIAPRLPEYHGFEVDYPAMELHLCCCQPLRTDPFEAVRIRGAIEFLNALATIPGFDPAENRGFWYRLIKSMTARYQCGANQLMRLPFKSNAFGKFHVFYSCTDQAVDNNVDVASYLQLLTSSAESSLSMKERAEALESLRYYLPTVSKSPTMASMEVHVPVLLEPLKSPKRFLVTRFSSGKIPCLTGITWCFTGLNDEVSTRLFRLSVRELVRQNTIERLRVRFGARSLEGVASLFSALPYMKSLKAVVVELGEFERQGHALDALKWVFWASMHFASRSNALDSLGLRCSCDRPIADAFLQVITSPNAAISRLSNTPPGMTLIQTGTTAWLAAQANVTFDYNGSKHLSVIQHAEMVDVVGLCGDRVCIILPGYSCVWADSICMSTWSTTCTSRGASGPEMWCIRELRIEGLCRTMVPIITMLRQIGVNLTSLILSTCVVNEADLATILDVCPHLTRFAFYHAVRRCLKPLIDAYASSSGCQISTLALHSEFVRGAEQEMLDPLLKTLNDPTHPMSQRLRILRLSNKPFRFDEQQVLSEILQTNSVLEFLSFTGEREVQTLIKSHDGKLMCVTKEGKDSLYEFLLCAKRAAAPLDGVKVLAVECLRLVALVAAQRVRQRFGISYQHGRNDLF